MSICSKRKSGDCGSSPAVVPHALASAFSASASRSNSSPPRRLSKVIQDIRSKREALAAHTGMSLCLVEFVASSPLGWLPVFPPSPRVSPDLLHKRNLRLSSGVDDEAGPSRLVLSDQELQVQSAVPHLAYLKEDHRCGHAGSRIEKQVCNPEREQKQRLVRKRIWVQVAKFTLLVMVVSGFLCTGKAAALSITSIAFVAFRLLWNIRNYAIFLTKSFAFLRSTDLHKNHPTSVQSVREIPMQHREDGSKELQMKECRKEAERKEMSSPKSHPMGWNSRAAKKKLHASLRTLSLQIPHRAASHLSNSVPSTPTNSLLSPNTNTEATKTITNNPHFTKLKPLSRLTTKGAASPTGIISPPCARMEEHSHSLTRSITTSTSPCTDWTLDRGEIGSCHKAAECVSESKQEKKSESQCIISGGWAITIAILVTMGGLVQGRLPALLSTACWFLVVSCFKTFSHKH
eukprot:c13502_g1_i1 orf=67-1449(+)